MNAQPTSDDNASEIVNKRVRKCEKCLPNKRLFSLRADAAMASVTLDRGTPSMHGDQYPGRKVTAGKKANERGAKETGIVGVRSNCC